MVNLKIDKQLQKILYIEDNVDDRFFMRYTFEKVCPEIIIDEVDNGEDALSVLRSKDVLETYQIIFLDIKLPKYSAFEVLSILRDEKSVIPLDKILILSTSNTDIDRRKASDLGITDVISKPIDEKTLKVILSKLGYNLP